MTEAEKPTFEKLETPRLILRRFREDDLAALVSYRNDPRIAQYQMWESYDETRGKDLIEKNKNKSPGDEGYCQLALEYKATGELIGDFMLKTQEDKRLAEIGYTLAFNFHGKGLAREAATAVIDYAFIVLNIHRLSATADPRNLASLKLLERLGFRKEAHFVKSLWFKGEWADDVVYGLLEEEWHKNKVPGLTQNNQ
jgi:RimJ/RimL family protein N-acetyltransferase